VIAASCTSRAFAPPWSADDRDQPTEPWWT
jgi:hypothetical protein